jgi:hypothetical protein
VSVALTLDQFDNWAFPSSGYNLSVDYRGYRDGLGADIDYDKALVDFSYAFRFARHSVIVGGRFGNLAVGYAEGGSYALYLFLGRR